jgi:organic radical activating enzyme
MAEQFTDNTKNEDRIKILEIKRDQINEVSPSFCTAKWLQTTLYLQTGFNHSCHHPSPHKIPVKEVLENPAALHNSKFKKEQREKMLAGERPKECDYCWNIEDLDNKYFSDRHYKTSDYWAWDRFDEITNSNPEDDIFPSYLEVSFSNACNFACSYCSPDISSKWMKDIKSNGPYPVKFGSHHLSYLREREQFPYSHDEYNPYVEAFDKWFPEAYPHLKVFRITGGEPTMSKDFWKTLDFILENPRPDLEISINTNLGTPKELIDRLIVYAKKLDETCKECLIFTSCEAYKEQAEYIRDGMNYDYWYSNIVRFLV